MITPAYVRKMSQYSAWQNRSLYAAARTLSHDDRMVDRGAFFGSIHATLSHVLWGDQAWMRRFAQTPEPRGKTISEALTAYATWDQLERDRFDFDAVIADWAETLQADWLEGDLTWVSAAEGQELTRPKWVLVTHMFNHQTHHRGQVHAMLTAAGARPEKTDIPFMPQ
ncbi:MAG: DinB family protein [Pseudomonadota bacterium]